ncbi:uncharacterized protein LOC133186822 [Saccostrea echinata]|uniref:uncharacterized protein LOC133186822 n=1 Tax=Saccostrea echinata TaxID=191078 RepID=UPI002A83FEA8|nr:uncharacterized protein LOC133186822 [Saccostrea echinata]
MPHSGAMWLCLLSLSYLISYGSSLNCYECQSKDDTVCLDPFTDSRKEVVGEAECSEKATHCVKYKTIMHLLDSGFITGRAREIVVTSRFCLIKPGASDGCIAVEGDGSFYIQCLCSTDNCNSGRSLLPNIFVILVTCLTASWFLRR